jgi:transcription antitermination factor NusG
MPAKSKAQQRYFGMVRAGKIKKPEGMTNKEVEKMASTKHKGLPDKVEETMTFKDFLVAEAKGEFKNKYEIGDKVKTTLGNGQIKDIDQEKRKIYVLVKAKDQTNPSDKPKDMVFSMGHGDIKGHL